MNMTNLYATIETCRYHGNTDAAIMAMSVRPILFAFSLKMYSTKINFVHALFLSSNFKK